MDSRKLQHFVVLADELHFSRAAQRVHLTQSALSRSILALENELGARLFDRFSPKLTLTPIGRAVLMRAKELVLDVNSLQREVDLMLRGDTGRVAIGAGPFPAATFMAAMLAELGREHPDTHVEFRIANWAALLKHLLDENIEFFVADVRNLPDEPRIDIAPLARQPIGFACHAGHPLAGRKLHSPSEMLSYPLATPTPPPDFQVQLNRYLKLGVSDQPPFLVCDSPSLLIQVGLNSDAVIMTTHDSMRRELEAGTLVTLRLPRQPFFFAEMGIVRLAKRSLSPLAQWMIKEIRARTAELPKKRSGRSRAS